MLRVSDFQWRVNPQGYQVIVPQGEGPALVVEEMPSRYLAPVDQGTERSMTNTVRSYFPLRERTGLFKDFAEVVGDETSIIAFANEFGLLGLPASSDTGESIETWQVEIKRLAEAISLWAALTERSKRGVEQLRWAGLQNSANEILRLTAVEPYLLWNEDAARLQIGFFPANLLGALWVQFARAIELGLHYKRCHQCMYWFEESGRSDKQFCSDACRSRTHRIRGQQGPREKYQRLSELVLRMHHQGLGASDIAEQLDVSRATVYRKLTEARLEHAAGRPSAELQADDSVT